MSQKPYRTSVIHIAGKEEATWGVWKGYGRGRGGGEWLHNSPCSAAWGIEVKAGPTPAYDTVYRYKLFYCCCNAFWLTLVLNGWLRLVSFTKELLFVWK